MLLSKSKRGRMSTAPQLAQRLIDRGVACGAGHFYAINFPKLMKLEDNGGFTRISFFHYHTLEDVKYVVKILKDISKTVGIEN